MLDERTLLIKDKKTGMLWHARGSYAHNVHDEMVPTYIAISMEEFLVRHQRSVETANKRGWEYPKPWDEETEERKAILLKYMYINGPDRKVGECHHYFPNGYWVQEATFCRLYQLRDIEIIADLSHRL